MVDLQPSTKGAGQVLIVIPALNEASRLAAVIADIRAHSGADILIVDDGSTDGTAEVARAAGARVATHAINLGYGVALQTGYRYAYRHGYSAVVQLDADGQHVPASIPALVAALAEADLVVGSRFLGGGSYRPTAIRRIGMHFFAALARLLSRQRLTDPTSGFQAISRQALRFYMHERYPPDFPDADVLVMAARAGLRVAEIAVDMRASPPGKSMHRGILKPLYYVFKMSLALALIPFRRDRR